MTNEVETLEAALKFISDYELSTDAASTETNAVNVTSAFQHSHKLSKAHSLEIPERHAFQHSHSLEIPKKTNDALDPDMYAAEAFLEDIKMEPELLDSTPVSPGEMQDLLSMCPTLNETKPQSGTGASTACKTSPSSSTQPRRRMSKKEKIRDLRDTVAELSQQLGQLQASSTPNSPAAEDAHVGSILSPSESLWQQVAARQLLLRQKAEKTNAQLRQIVETRVRQT